MNVRAIHKKIEIKKTISKSESAAFDSKITILVTRSMLPKTEEQK